MELDTIATEDIKRKNLEVLAFKLVKIWLKLGRKRIRNRIVNFL